MKKYMRNFDFDTKNTNRTEKILVILSWWVLGLSLFSLSVFWIQVLLFSTFSIKLTLFQIVKGLFLVGLVRFITDWNSFLK